MAKNLMVNRRNLFGNGIKRTARELIHWRRGMTVCFCQVEAGEECGPEDVLFDLLIYTPRTRNGLQLHSRLFTADAKLCNAYLLGYILVNKSLMASLFNTNHVRGELENSHVLSAWSGAI